MDLALRALVIFALLLVVTRAVGRRELSTMEPFDLILLVVIGDLIQQGVTQSDYSLTGTLIVLSVIAVLTVVTSYVSSACRGCAVCWRASRSCSSSTAASSSATCAASCNDPGRLAAVARQRQIDDLGRVQPRGDGDQRAGELLREDSGTGESAQSSARCTSARMLRRIIPSAASRRSRSMYATASLGIATPRWRT